MELVERLTEFVAWSRQHIAGDEKGEAQIFLDHLFRALGQPGCLEVGGALEYLIRKASEDGGGTAFADLVWKPVVLVEMKKRGENLQRHYRQAFDYWTRLVPGRPRYVILCNFDEFRIYDFETQMDSPVDTVALRDLPERWGALAFLCPGDLKPVFANDRVAATREAADMLARCFRRMMRPNRQPRLHRATAQRFILQMLVALFAEDIGLLEKYFVSRLLSDCRGPADSFDLIGGLFKAMNTNPPVGGGRFKGVNYFNGGLFARPVQIELLDLEVVELRKAAAFDWSKVQPEIFGTLFQQSMDEQERHAFGAHFTHPADIMKIVGPTIVEPWKEQLQAADTPRRLGDLLIRLQEFRVLDPACGSGNFLCIAYRELKRIEAEIFQRINQVSKSSAPDQMRLSFLSAGNFYGIDILPFAVELAKVSLMIARKLAVDELHINEPTLPLDNLGANFRTADALLCSDGRPISWPKADVIIGNPPFLDARKMTLEHGRGYVAALEKAYPGIPRRADFCTYWFRKTADSLPACSKQDPCAGRAGLVGTQNVRNNESREGGLDHIVKSGSIVEAVENQPWSGEASVHVSIVNWVKTADSTLLPKKRRLWHKVEPDPLIKRERKRGAGLNKDFQLQYRECDFINSALSDQTDVSAAICLVCCVSPKVVFEGVQTGHDGFVIGQNEAADLLKADRRHKPYIKPFLNGSDLLSGRYRTKPEFVIDLSSLDILQASALPQLLAVPQDRVVKDWRDNAQKEREESGRERGEHQNRLDTWWALKRPRNEMQEAIKRLPRYIACSAVMKRATFVFLCREWLPTNALKIVAFADDYSFGILQSHVHWLWFITKCSKLKSDFRYTPESVFDTFPWPQRPSVKQIEAVAAAGREIRRVREEALRDIKGGLRALYRTLELPGANPLKAAHAALDAAVFAAYGFSEKKDLLAQLLALNHEVAAKIKRGEPVTSPGVPGNHPDPARLVSEDCIRPEPLTPSAR